ncbi:MAG TPA: cell division protein FtsZ [Verrucomicrobiae bacterium]|nr:cell division protein FtsZ [Verrucomicrobiae bacterium]
MTSPNSAAGQTKRRAVTIMGVGTAGVTMVESLAGEDFPDATFVAINADGSVPTSRAELVRLESKLLRGMGTGGDPERGRELAEENFEALKNACSGAEVVMLVAGLGGGAGSGASPVIARAARESGALVLAFVTLPFNCEGNQRQRLAQIGLDQLCNVADGVICLPHQKAAKLLEENCGFAETFGASAKVLIEGMRGVWRLLRYRGLIEIHFDELCAVLREQQGESYFAALEASGTTRARDVLEKLPAHPLLDGGAALKQAETVLVSVMGGPDLSMAEVNRVMEDITSQCPNAKVIMGAAVDETFRDRLAVTLIATRRRKHDTSKATQPKTTEAELPAPEFESELIHPSKPERPSARLVPPAPALTAEQREQLLAKQTGRSPRARKTGPRMKQTTLPLDIVNKGRFDKSEPTIHKGEDLDLPTYVRRGISLN